MDKEYYINHIVLNSHLNILNCKPIPSNRLCFLQGWNGASLFPPPLPSGHVYSNASGTYGCGAFAEDLGWFQAKWPAEWEGLTIQEILFPF